MIKQNSGNPTRTQKQLKVAEGGSNPTQPPTTTTTEEKNGKASWTVAGPIDTRNKSVCINL